MLLVVHRSRWTGHVAARELPITEAQIHAWFNGALIQDAFPQLEAPEREFLKTGYTREDWVQMFGAENTSGDVDDGSVA
jgi:hypothetical protein